MLFRSWPHYHISTAACTCCCTCTCVSQSRYYSCLFLHFLRLVRFFRCLFLDLFPDCFPRSNLLSNLCPRCSFLVRCRLLSLVVFVPNLVRLFRRQCFLLFLKLTEEVTEVKERVKNIVGERALQGWAQRQLMTISDSELKSYSEGAGWTKGWSEGSSQGTSQSEGKHFGGSVGVKVLGNGGNISGNYGYNESVSQNTSESKSENKRANTSKSSIS